LVGAEHALSSVIISSLELHYVVLGLEADAERFVDIANLFWGCLLLRLLAGCACSLAAAPLPESNRVLILNRTRREKQKAP